MKLLHDTSNRILTIAENAWAELVKRKVLYILAATFLFCFLVPVYIIQKGWMISVAMGNKGEASPVGTIIVLDQFVLFIGLCVAILYAAGSVESETSRRTLTSVMIRPIHRWEYLAGRTLSIVLFFFLFASLAVILSYGTAFLFGYSMPDVFLRGIVQRFCKGTAWIIIAVSLGSVISSASTVTVLVLIGVSSLFIPRISSESHWIIPIINNALHYTLPSTWPTDFLELSARSSRANQSLMLNALVLIENLMYGVVAFIGSSWLFTKRDLKLRE